MASPFSHAQIRYLGGGGNLYNAAHFIVGDIYDVVSWLPDDNSDYADALTLDKDGKLARAQMASRDIEWALVAI